MTIDHNGTSDSFRPAELTENARVVVEKRYLRKGANGEYAEDSLGMFRRVADALAEPDRQYGATDEQVEETAQRFYEIMATLEYLPNSPTLMNAGTGAGTLSACFVLPLSDSMEGIMGAAHDAAMVQKFGGGTGFALSELRRKGAHIKTTHGKACGPVAVLKHLSSVSTLVTQGGKRDGANMAVMDVHHPDIMEFIDCKQVEGDIHNFNISVGVSDEFMEAVDGGTTYPLRAPVDPSDPDSEEETVGRLEAREVFEKIVQGAWRNGEPGMIFLDEVNRNSPVLHVGRITATNPCGEQPLLPNESCNLGSIDLSKFVVGDYATGVPTNGNSPDNGAAPQIDWARIGRTVRTSVHMLDNVIDANQYAVDPIRDMTFHTRKIGLGVMGFADMLVQLGHSLRLGKGHRDRSRDDAVHHGPGRCRLGRVGQDPRALPRLARRGAKAARRGAHAKRMPVDGRAHRHDLDDRRLLQRYRAALLAGIPQAQHPRRPDALLRGPKLRTRRP